MTTALTDIIIYKPFASQQAYTNPDDGTTLFPVTDSCERNAKLMGDDYIKLEFKLMNKVVFDAFSYIEYNGQTFFLKEQYIPTPNGSYRNGSVVKAGYYSYSFKFVSVANMLTKHTCFRHVVVGDKEFDEPEINVSANLDTMYDIIIGSIPGAIMRLEAAIGYTSHYALFLESIYNSGLRGADGKLASNIGITANTELETFSFSGSTIADVCTSVANTFTDDDKDTEWYISESNGVLALHFCKCVSQEEGGADVLALSDYTFDAQGVDRTLQRYTTGGLKSAAYAQERTNVPQVLLPYGADRNMSYESVKGVDEITNLQATYGKRLRLEKNHTYTVRDKSGVEHTITTDSEGAIHVNGVNTGIEEVRFFDDVYPQCHIQVTSVSIRNKRQDDYIVPEYTIEGEAVDSQYNKAYLTQIGMYPLKIEEGQTLSIRFESGLLNGREFEVANKTTKDQGVQSYSLRVTIVADGSIEDGTLIPSGNFIPAVGDRFALFNMKMPEEFIDMARQDLAQKAYEKLCDIQDTKPEVKCVSDPTVFNETLYLGRRTTVNSEQFDGMQFSSRVISYSYKLPSPKNVTFNLASAIMRGTISTLQSEQAREVQVSDYLEQRSNNLSRRGWKDASETSEMLNSLVSEMMLVGNSRTQFYTNCTFSCVNQTTAGADGVKHFSYLKITNGEIRHTQDPYIGYANGGIWSVSNYSLNEDDHMNELDASTPYYLYAVVNASDGEAEMVLSSSPIEDETYLLVGILSSEFEDGDTSYRVFNRTNGYTSIAGGTITTEQVQDANRNLIVDFLNQRIIARNGAEIIGNIRFLSADGRSSSGGITSINGGLLLSEVLQLMDGDNVTAGMSGCSSDNVLLWGGGTFEEAQQESESVVTMLNKDGRGKIGCFRVVDKDTIAVNGAGGVLYITSKSIDTFSPFDMVTFPCSVRLSESVDADNRNVQSVAEVDVRLNVGSYEFSFPAITMHTDSWAQEVNPSAESLDEEHFSIDSTFSVYINKGGRTYARKIRAIRKKIVDGVTTINNNVGAFVLNVVATESGVYKIRMVLNSTYTLQTPAGWRGEAYCSCSFDANVGSSDRMCVYGCDGVSIISKSDISFKVYNNGGQLKLVANGLPVGNAGLVKGQLYTDSGGNLKVQMT